MRILCVDDDEDTRDLLHHLLEYSGLEAVAVQDTAAALRLIAQEQFSLYIIDGQLPGVSGLGLCEQIRQHDKETPVVIFSGHGYPADREAGMSAGANVYIVKPDISEVVPTVKRLLAEALAANS
jgi:DNA-binding response OmpR family regulator